MADDVIVIQVDRDDLLELRQRAETRGDAETVALVDRALGGDQEALARCVRVMLARVLAEPVEPS